MNTPTPFKGYAALSRAGPLLPFKYSPGPFGAEQVEIAVNYSGVCPADISMIEDAWGFSALPLVAGPRGRRHHRRGRAAGETPTSGPAGWLGLAAGELHVLPSMPVERTQSLPAARAHHRTWTRRFRRSGPLRWDLCPAFAGDAHFRNVRIAISCRHHRVQCDGAIRREAVGSHRVIGIGGLGHLALQFLNKWDYDVHAFKSSDGKRCEALRPGAHHVVDSRDGASMTKIAGSLDLILLTVDVPLDWETIIAALSQGRQVLLERIGADSGGGGAVPCASANRREFAGRQPRRSGHDARLLCPAQHRADHRDAPTLTGERRAGSTTLQ
jgi:alcohol/geraniol dehydrogenase (NADP+)